MRTFFTRTIAGAATVSALVASGRAAAEPKAVKAHSGATRPLHQCIGSPHVVSEHRRGLDGTETWTETCGKQVARCWIADGQTLCAENFPSASQHAPTLPSGNASAPVQRAPSPAATVERSTASRPIVHATLFDFDPAIVGDLTITHDQGLDRVTIPTELPVGAVCEVAAGFVGGPGLQRLAARFGGPVISAALAAADFDSIQDAPRLLFNVVGSDARGSALRLRVWEHQAHSIACAYDPRPELAPAFEKAINRFVSGIRWKSPVLESSKSELRVASLTGSGMERGASDSPATKPPTLAGIEWRHEVPVPSTHERTTEQLRIFLSPGATPAHLSIELRTETADAAGRLETASMQRGTRPSTTWRSTLWGTPNREGSCVESVDGLTMIRKCSEFRGIPTTAQTEARLQRALQGGGAFHFEQDELPSTVQVAEPTANAGKVRPYEIVRVAYQRKSEDDPGLVSVSAPTGATRLIMVDANGRVAREPIVALGAEVAWAPAQARAVEPRTQNKNTTRSK